MKLYLVKCRAGCSGTAITSKLGVSVKCSERKCSFRCTTEDVIGVLEVALAVKCPCCKKFLEVVDEVSIEITADRFASLLPAAPVVACSGCICR